MRPRALITGGAVRVGRAIALEMARHGYDVAVHYRRSESEALSAVESCRKAGAEAFAVQGDLEAPEGCRAIAAEVRRRWDTLDCLVNNASIFEPCPLDAIEVDAFDRMIAVNLRAPLLLSQTLLPLLRAAAGPERSALIVHVCDIGAERPMNGYAHYAVSKAGLVMLVKAMAVELAPEVRCVGVSPGQVAWPEFYDEAMREAIVRRIPMQRTGEPDDIARMIRFLALEGQHVNGAIVAVDGGMSCRY